MRLFFALLLCLSYISGNAQYEERPATLINRSDETIPGYVHYYDWNYNPKTIGFSAAKGGKAQTLPIKMVKQLSIKDGSVYEGLYLTVPYYAKGAIAIGSNIIYRTDSSYFWTELLLESEAVKFYRFFDEDDKIRFVVAKYDSLVVLNDIHIQLARRDKTYNYDVPEYQKTLKSVLSECPTLSTETTTYTENGIISLLKEYLTYCRIDSKIYREQKKISKLLVGLGGFGSLWNGPNGVVTELGVSAQFLLPKRFHNYFVLADFSRAKIANNFSEVRTSFGLYGGRYFGRGAFQGKIYTGLSVVLGPFDTGVGISYRKMISAEIRYPILFGILYKANVDDGVPINPLFNLRAIIPLEKRKSN